MNPKTTIYKTRHSVQPDVMGCAYPQLDLEVEVSYVKDGELSVLVSPEQMVFFRKFAKECE